ncbi:hypothetical protein FPOAC1_007285 [Fusarium poae]|uniref:hypothetical protein n=1 Tax=Fusarium poae TaxID=36050 RepID=UPI001CE8D6A0|nr:hypothetical protein FPOAC1_007285 [Fusarium poae]KAG8673966.1 hypothetical protein FPOAC1_007285 [Fusarium poae]
MTFPMTTWCAWEAKQTMRVPALSADIRDAIAGYHSSSTGGTVAFHKILETRVLLDGLPSHVHGEEQHPTNARAPKMVIWMMSFCVFLFNCFCYATTSFLLVKVAATSVFVLLVQGDVARKDHQSLEDMLNVSNQILPPEIF